MVWVYVLYDFCSLGEREGVLPTRIWSVLVNGLCELEKNLCSVLLGEVLCKCQLHPVDWWIFSVQPYPCEFSACWICQLLIERCSSLCNSEFIYFSLYLYQDFPHSGCPVAIQVHIKDCYVFLEYWPLYHYIMPFFTYDNFHCSEISSIILTYPSWLLLAVCIFLHLFIFNLYMHLYLICIWIDNM